LIAIFSSCFLVKKPLGTTSGAAALVAALLLPVQAQATVSDFLRSQNAVQGRVLIEAARAMPADRYSYAPDNDPMTFGGLIVHVAVGNYLFCSHIGGIPEPSVTEFTGNEPKDALVKRLQESFEFCTRALASVNDSKLAEVLQIGVIKTPRSMAILTLTGSWNTHVSLTHDYLSQNGQKVASPTP
jgi:DinB superfamily